MPEIQGLRKAQKNKNDEFYTSLEDIEKEMKYYREQFYGKTVFCNCDDPFESNFFKYFALNFNTLKLKKLICTCYAGSPIVYEQLSLLDVKPLKISEETPNKPYKIEINEIPDSNDDGATDLTDVEYLIKNKENTLSLLKGDGDFRSEECIELLKESDIVVTNPPFSLFREYIAQLIKYNKDFLIIGNMNAATYKEIFPLFKNNQVWFGYNSPKIFITPDRTEKKFDNILWYTNLESGKRHCRISLKEKYYGNEGKYPKYDNYDAIEVSKVINIPCDYDGLMGVPVTFLNKYCPEQFQLIGHDHDLTGDGGAGISDGQFICKGKNVYKRILIKLVKNN